MRISTKLRLGFIITCFVIIPTFQITVYFYLKSFISSIDNITADSIVFFNAESAINFQLNKIAEFNKQFTPNQDIQKKTLITESGAIIDRSFSELNNTINARLSSMIKSEAVINKLQHLLTDLKSIHREIIAYLKQVQHDTAIRPNEYLKIQQNLLKASSDFTAIVKEENKLIPITFDKTGKRTGGFVLLTFFSIFLVALLITYSIVKRLKSLIHTTEQIKEKKYLFNIEDKHGDELAMLTSTFTNMALSLSRSIEYITNLIKIIPNILIVTSNHFIIKDINQAGIAELGFSKEELLNVPLPKLLPQDVTTQQDLVNPIKTSFQTKSGKEIPIYLSSAIINNIENNEVERIFIAQNISQLLNAEKQIITNARQAGMADIASAMLHNIGNILNTINVSSSVLIDTINKCKIRRLSKLMLILQENKEQLAKYFAKDTNSSKIGEYIIALASDWLTQNEVLSNEIGLITKKIEQIHHIITVQQQIYDSLTVVEPTAINTLLEEALNICLKEQEIQVTVERCYSEIDMIKLDHNRLLDVFITLIANSLESLKLSPHSTKLLKLTIKVQDADQILIMIENNGVGISKDDLAKVFYQGFSSPGNSISLHNSALAIARMRGTLEVKSDDLQHGTCYIITLPLKIKGSSLQEQVMH